MILSLILAVAQASAAPAVPPVAATPAKQKLICETEEQIGSRLGAKRICHTAEEWDRLRYDDRQAIEQNQKNVNFGNPGGG